jgi:hypothetical protein
MTATSLNEKYENTQSFTPLRCSLFHQCKKRVNNDLTVSYSSSVFFATAMQEKGNDLMVSYSSSVFFDTAKQEKVNNDLTVKTQVVPSSGRSVTKLE